MMQGGGAVSIAAAEKSEQAEAHLDMLLEGDMEALGAYLAGDRATDRVRSYFQRRGIPLPSAEISASAGFAVAEAGNT